MYLKLTVLTSLALMVPVSLEITKETKTLLQEYLRKYGYLNSLDNITDAKLSEALKDYQSFYGMQASGVMGKDVEDLMKRPRCGIPDSSHPKGTAAATYVWRSKKLTYKLLNTSQTIPYPAMKKVFADSVKKWTNLVNLQITEAKNKLDDVDIQVQFSPQDGPGNTLGYAYYPETGDIYFDSLENWGLSHADGVININWVTIHELGHSLGLDHSDEPTSVMYPYYYPSSSLDITRKDETRIRVLYGSNPSRGLCKDSSIDAIVNVNKDKSMRLLKGDKYWTLTKSGKMIKQEGTLGSIYRDFPNNIDAAFNTGKVTYFFKSNVFYRYKIGNKKFVKKLISVGFEGIPSNLDAAFFNRNDKRIYFFKGSLYHVFDTTKPQFSRIVLNGSKIADDWKGIPDDVEGVSYLSDNKVIFMKSGVLYKVNLDGNTSVPGYPKSLKTDILSC